jgi:type IV secretory pathway VirJ component
MTAILARILAVMLAASVLGACATLGPPLPQHPHARKALLPNLAIVEAPSPPTAPHGDTFVVFYSGDGGWASFDRGVAGALADKG